MSKVGVEKVFLIDDSDIDLFIQKRFLEVYHFASGVSIFNSASEALKALEETPAQAPDIIFLDLNMPDADGFTFLKKFAKLDDAIRSKSKIVVLTSSESQIDRDFVLSFDNVKHFISKPLKLQDIEELKTIFG